MPHEVKIDINIFDITGKIIFFGLPSHGIERDFTGLLIN